MPARVTPSRMRTSAILRSAVLLGTIAFFAACGTAPTDPAPPRNAAAKGAPRADDYTGQPCEDFETPPEGYVCRTGALVPNG